MSDHTWIQENIASYLADGLDPAERQRMEQHLAACTQCSGALQQVRSLDDAMHDLFAGVRPGPGLEQRMVEAVRLAPRPRWRRFSLSAQVAAGVAAVLLVGVLGALITDRLQHTGLPFPGARGSDSTLIAQNLIEFLWQSDAEETPMPPGSNDIADVDALARQTRERAIVELDSAESAQSTSSFAFSPDGGKIARDMAASFDDATQPSERDSYYSRNGDVGGMPGSNVPRSRGGAPARPATADVGGSLNSIDLQDGTSQSVILGENLGVYQSTGRGGGGLGGGEQVGGQRQGQAPQSDQTAGQRDLARSNESNFRRSYYSYRNNLGTAPGEAAASERRSAGQELAPPPYFKPIELHADIAARKGESRELLEEREPTGDTLAMQKQADKPQTAVPGQNVAPAQAQPPAVTQRKIIRSGEMEFEVDSFDSAVEQITKITSEEGGFIATVDSEQLPNGKVRGSVVVRVPPERLDTLVLKLRALGELKSQKIGSQDITKQYTDLESRLRAARAMEERLLEMIKNGQGDIEHLLEAEKELGVWRTKIEEIEGQLRYYNNVIALSTLRIGLAEKEIRAAAALTETERVQMGIEVEDVDKAHREALDAIAEAGGLVTKSEVKQHAAEQYSALIHFEVAREAAGPLRDRLRQIGHVSRLEIDRVQQAQDGTSRPADGRTVRKDTQFVVSLYNVANVAPRKTVHLNLACTDAETTYKSILQQVEQAGGRVVTSSLSSNSSDKTTGTIQFEVPTGSADAVLTGVKTAGEVMRLEETENPDSQNVTKSKRGFNVQLWAMGLVAPRETIVLQVATDDVPAAYQALQEAVRKTTGRILNAQLNEQDKQNITAQLDFDIPRDAQPDLIAAVAAAGEVFSRTATRSQDDANVIDSKVRLQMSLINQARIPPRETVTLGIEVTDVDQTTAALTAIVAQSKGRTAESHLAHERSGRVTAKLVFDVPLAQAATLVEQIKASGIVRAQQSARNPRVPDGKLAIARLDVTLSNAELIVPRDEGLWAQTRKGLATSFAAISWSLVVVIVGLCFVLPWALVLYVVYRVIARLRRKAVSGTPAG